MDRMQSYREARQRGTDWLLSQMNEDGSIGPVDQSFYYYRLPWTFTITGHTDAALRVCDWMRANQFSADGDFVGASPRVVEAYAYQNAVVVYGAQMLRQFDLSYGGWRRLQVHRDAESGGFTHLPPGNGPGKPADENVPTVAQLGKTALVMGDLAAAEAAAGWMRMVWERQPALPDRLFYVYNAETQDLVTEFPADLAFHYVVEAQQPRQRFTCGGIAAAFLVRLYLATGDPAHVDLARAYMAFSMNSTERQFEVSQVCKSGWGSALLYQVTKEDQYRDWTCRVADYFVADQCADGRWEDSGPYGRTLDISIMSTAEFVMILDTMISSLST